jgi:Flp pilus assembly protein protease CpaA
MNKKTIDMDFINDILDALGLTAIMVSVMIKLSQWLLKLDWSNNLSLVLLIVSIIYALAKTKNIHLDNKIKKKELEK